MNELSAWIKPYPTVLQPQRGMADLADLDTRNIKVERLPLDVQAVLRDSPAPLHELRIVLRRPIAGNHMDLAGAINGFVHEINVLEQLHIDGGNFSCVMATQNMIHLIQRRQVIVPCVITIADSQSFVRVHVEEGELGVRKLGRARDRGTQNPTAEQQQSDNGRFQECSASPRPGIWMLQRIAPEEGTIQSVRTTLELVSKVSGSVNPFLWMQSAPPQFRQTRSLSA